MLDRREAVRVGVERDAHRRASQAFAHDLRVRAGNQLDRGVRVAEVVEPDVGRRLDPLPGQFPTAAGEMLLERAAEPKAARALITRAVQTLESRTVRWRRAMPAATGSLGSGA